MKKILINMTNRLGGGSLQVGLSFLNEIKGNDEYQFYVLLNSSNEALIKKDDFSKCFQFFTINYSSYFLLGRILSKIENEIKPDIVFSVFGPVYWTPKAKHIMGYATPYCIYPENPFFKMVSIKEKLVIELKKKLHYHLCKREADVIILETDDARIRFSQFLKSKKIQFYTVSNSCSNYFTHFSYLEPSFLPEKKDEFRFLLLSKYYSHKNFEIIPKIIRKIKDKHDEIRFVLTLPNEDYNRLIPEDLRNFVYNVGYVRVEDCPQLYAECDALFQPSFLEVFSAMYPEAMCMQKPIIASDFSFARSICKSAALYFNATDENDAVAKISELLDNKNLQKELIKNGLEVFENIPSANDRALKYLEIIDKSLYGEGK